MRELKKRIGLSESAKSGAGFTLVELLVVVTMTVIISLVSVVNFRAAEKKKRVSLASDTVTSVARSTQTFALAGKNTNNSNVACRVPQYYYISFDTADKTHVTIKAQNTCGTGDLIETFTLPQNTQIRVNGITLDGTLVNSTLLIYFTPPFGQITASKDGGSSASFTTANIIVESVDGSVSKTVTVDGVAGKIGE